LLFIFVCIEMHKNMRKIFSDTLMKTQWDPIMYTALIESSCYKA
jgi:hypothetical protein